jgi:phosphoribosylformimino-5-aminoimidazole carboxamide ribotide isomerase
MQLIPAVDIKNGKCVRLSQGKADQETVYSNDPVSMAIHWDDLGAKTIHVVDLDGAFTGKPTNSHLVKEIINSSSVNIQVGGGIRTMESIDTYIDLGAARVVLGTIAFKDPKLVETAAKKYPGKIIVGIDARDGNVAIKGWVEVSSKKATDFAKSFEDMGVAGFVFTDISRDGMLEGPNIKSVSEFSEATSIPVIASGGVSRLEDISNLLALKPLGVNGIILGKSLYDKTVDFKKALELVEENAS